MNKDSDAAERAVPVNTIASTALDEPAEYAGGERMYAVLFAEDHEGVSLDANGDVAVLLDREQAEAARETLDEIVTALGGEASSEEEVVVRNMDSSTAASVADAIAEAGIKREVIRVE